MLTKRIIPCLDVAAGRVVKGISFVNLRDAGDPVELAAYYNAEGADELVFLDITASYENRATMLDVVRRTAEQVFIPVTVGGGIRSVEDIRATLGAGADKTSLNTAAVQNPDLLRQGAEQFGAQCIVLAIDARSNAAMPSNYEVFIHGGRTATGMDVLEWAQRGVVLGAGEILLTSMDRDGTQQGYDLALNATSLLSRLGARHRLWRRRHTGAFLRRPDSWWSRCSIGRIHFPLRPVSRLPGQGLSTAKGGYGAAMLKFDRQGLIPVVIQDDATSEVLMVAFMNEEALQRTRETGYTHFFSRSRNTIWHKGEQSGNIQQVRDILVNCEENSLLIHVVQQGGAACHTGYRSCYYRRLLPNDTYETIAERVFDPETVYKKDPATVSQWTAPLESTMRQLYGVYLYLRDHDLSEESNTSRLLQEHSQSYLAARFADELEELTEVQSGDHVHVDKESDTILEGSQVGYWLLLLAATLNLRYEDFLPHASVLKGYQELYSQEKAIEQQQQCLNLLTSNDSSLVAQGLQLGFAFIGWACAEARISPLAPAEFDLEQMRRKGLIGK